MLKICAARNLFIPYNSIHFRTFKLVCVLRNGRKVSAAYCYYFYVPFLQIRIQSLQQRARSFIQSIFDVWFLLQVVATRSLARTFLAFEVDTHRYILRNSDYGAAHVLSSSVVDAFYKQARKSRCNQRVLPFGCNSSSVYLLSIHSSSMPVRYRGSFLYFIFLYNSHFTTLLQTT